MKRLRNFLFYIVVLTSCTQNDRSYENKEMVSVDSTDGQTVRDKNKTGDNKPSILFLELLDFVDSLGYYADTARLKKTEYYGYSNNNLRFFGRHAVYNLAYDEHVIHYELMNEKDSPDSLTNLNILYHDSINLNFQKVKNIFGYIWTYKKNDGNVIPDGAIEQWEFTSPVDAKKAFDFLELHRNPISWPYFKIGSFYSQCDKFLFIFHSRNTGFNYRNKKFQKRLTDKCFSS